MEDWMFHAWYRRETLTDLQKMTYREIRVAGKWGKTLFEAEQNG